MTAPDFYKKKNAYRKYMYVSSILELEIFEKFYLIFHLYLAILMNVYI